MAIRGAVLLALSQDATTKLFEALRYGECFYWFMGGTLVLGLHLTLCGIQSVTMRAAMTCAE